MWLHHHHVENTVQTPRNTRRVTRFMSSSVTGRRKFRVGSQESGCLSGGGGGRVSMKGCRGCFHGLRKLRSVLWALGPWGVPCVEPAEHRMKDLRTLYPVGLWKRFTLEAQGRLGMVQGLQAAPALGPSLALFPLCSAPGARSQQGTGAPCLGVWQSFLRSSHELVEDEEMS